MGLQSLSQQQKDVGTFVKALSVVCLSCLLFYISLGFAQVPFDMSFNLIDLNSDQVSLLGVWCLLGPYIRRYCSLIFGFFKNQQHGIGTCKFESQTLESTTSALIETQEDNQIQESSSYMQTPTEDFYGKHDGWAPTLLVLML